MERGLHCLLSMTNHCPNCPHKISSARNSHQIVRFGQFYRHCDQALVQRYKCKDCGKTFSDARFSPLYRHRIRHLNWIMMQLFCAGISQRRCAHFLNIDPKTVVRKFCLLGEFSLSALSHLNVRFGPFFDIQFDDLETFEHTKYKPLSVTIAVENKTRRILGFKVAKMPAKGLLAGRALKKYGKREDERKTKRCELFSELKDMVSPIADIQSDMNPHYEGDVRQYFPKADYEQFRGRRGCVVGQGELKAGGFDPLYSLNHTCAMLRANINRLFRKTWCTTKRPDRLELHIAIYAVFHNVVLLNK